MRCLRLNPTYREHLSMIVLSPVFAPRKLPFMPRKPNGVGILVTPGGSYRRVVMDKEGSVLAPIL